MPCPYQLVNDMDMIYNMIDMVNMNIGKMVTTNGPRYDDEI
jgi:hypothetical protein